MLYWIIKPLIRVALHFFFRKIYVCYSKPFKIKGPLLVTANHPNSFLDAILIGAFFNRPVHFLARGDAFKKPIHRFLLNLLNMIPIYRLSEGKENLYLNEYAFKASQQVLQQDGIVLIFIEGICLLTHQIQPFKKGAARIALEYKGASPLQVLPLGIAYSRLNSWGATVALHLGNPLSAKALLPYEDPAKNLRHFNDCILQELGPLINLPNNENPKTNLWVRALGNLGYILHRRIFYWLDIFVRKKTRNTVFHDSVLFALLFISYPILFLVVAFLAISIVGWIAIIPLFLLLMMVRCIVLVKNPNE